MMAFCGVTVTPIHIVRTHNTKLQKPDGFGIGYKNAQNPILRLHTRGLLCSLRDAQRLKQNAAVIQSVNRRPHLIENTTLQIRCQFIWDLKKSA
jgi:hypothetical protein